ncbi:lipopolysaccharide biosynthesis protein [Caldicellulosiruptoraceae bacterium PP1]
MNILSKKNIQLICLITVLFFVLSVVVVLFTTKTLWTAEENIKIDNSLLNPLSQVNNLSPVSNMIQGIYSNLTNIEINKEYLEMVALNSPFIDYVKKYYGEDERLGITVDLKASKNGIFYLILKSTAPTKDDSLKMLSKYETMLKTQISTELISKSKTGQKMLMQLKNQIQTNINEKNKDVSNEMLASLYILEWYSDNFNNLIDINKAIGTYGEIKNYESVGSKFEKAIRIVAGTFAGLFIGVLAVLIRERNNIIKSI